MFVGSSAHNQKRKNYILYTASKASLNSMPKVQWNYFKNIQLKIYIIHPPAMKSKMRKKIFEKIYFKIKVYRVEPKKIANKNFKKIENMKKKFWLQEVKAS